MSGSGDIPGDGLDPDVLDTSDLDIFVPDHSEVGVALSRTTDLGVVAHPDDIEFGMLPAVGACRDDPERWFTGIVCTDGAGSVRSGSTADLTSEEFVRMRRDEQIRAARIGRYSAVIQLGVDSASVRDVELGSLLRACSPVNLWTHDLADSHPTHVAVGLACVLAARGVQLARRPMRTVGVEGWRSLDWLPDEHRLLLDASAHIELGRELMAVFETQIDAGKSYEDAVEGRRRANATFADPRRRDELAQAVLAMDLTPLVRHDGIDPSAYLIGSLERFSEDVQAALAQPS